MLLATAIAAALGRCTRINKRKKEIARKEWLPEAHRLLMDLRGELAGGRKHECQRAFALLEHGAWAER
eukprot:scaffold4174_cov122-Isochrysis_galbana.AAC.3